MDDCTDAITRRAPAASAWRSRYSITSVKLWPVSMCITGNGMSAGANAFTARCRSTAESFPPEKSSTGRSHSAATSRMMKIAWDSKRSRWSTFWAAVSLMLRRWESS